MIDASAPIGVFDSGIGGLSILKALLVHLPAERFVYFADTAHNPYGEKSEAFVQERTLAVARELVERHQIKALVVACNTATAAAIELLRAAYPSLPVVGLEPALKPAAQVSRTGRVGVLATRGTLQSVKFAQLRKKLESEYAATGQALSFVCTPCDGLAERIERLALEAIAPFKTPDLIATCAYFLEATGQFGLKNEALDTLVLGCTHYPLVRQVFAQAVGAGVQIVDNAMPVALRTQQLLASAGMLQSSNAQLTDDTAQVQWHSSASQQSLQRSARYWLV